MRISETDCDRVEGERERRSGSFGRYMIEQAAQPFFCAGELKCRLVGGEN